MVPVLQGKPRPVVTWFRDDALLEDKSVGTRTSELDTILFIRSAERSHSGKYTLTVQIENMSDSADIYIQVVGQCSSSSSSGTSSSTTSATRSLVRIRAAEVLG